MAPVDKSKVPWWVSNLIVPLVNLTLALRADPMHGGNA